MLYHHECEISLQIVLDVKNVSLPIHWKGSQIIFIVVVYQIGFRSGSLLHVLSDHISKLFDNLGKVA